VSCSRSFLVFVVPAWQYERPEQSLESSWLPAFVDGGGKPGRMWVTGTRRYRHGEDRPHPLIGIVVNNPFCWSNIFEQGRKGLAERGGRPSSRKSRQRRLRPILMTTLTTPGTSNVARLAIA